MSSKILLLLVLVGLLAVKTTNAEGGNNSGGLSSILAIIQQLIHSLLNLTGAQKPLPVRQCGVLENGKQYYMKTEDGRYAVLDKNKQLAFVKQVPSTDASKFTAIKMSCNVYGLCVGNSCMSRCQKCTSDTGDYQTVKFNLNNSNSRSSQWTLTSPRGVSGGPYNLKIDGSHGFLRYKRTKTGNYQLTLSTVISNESNFVFEKVEQNCGILKNGKEYFLKTSDGRFAVLDKNKQLAFVRNVPERGASKFTVTQKSCNVYGLCVDGNCMSRCGGCASDTGDKQTVKFQIPNSDSSRSRWTVTFSVVGGLYNLKIDGIFGYLTTKKTPGGEYQLTLSTTLGAESNFQFVDVATCGLLDDGKEYFMKTADGKYAVLDQNKQMGFVKEIPEADASRFTAVQKRCNVYGLCVDGNCMSRCEECASDAGDNQTVIFNLPNSDSSSSQWTVTSSRGPYNLKIDGTFGYLTTKQNSNGDNQLTLSTGLTSQSDFTFVEVPICNTLAEDKDYVLQAADGRYAVLDKNKQLGFMKQVPATGASIFAARQNGCNVYGLYVDGYSMSKCEGCESDTGDNQTVKFSLPDSNNAPSHWTITSSEGGFYNFEIDDPFGYLIYKETPYGDDQLTLETPSTVGSRRKRQAQPTTTTHPPVSNFQLVEQSLCEPLVNGKEYFMITEDGRYAVVDKDKQLAFVKQVPESGASRFTAVKKSCNVYGLCINGNCMSRCEGCASESGDYQNVKFHLPNSDDPWSQWTIGPRTLSGFHSLKIDGPHGFLTYKEIPNSDALFSISFYLTTSTYFLFVDASTCNILEDGKKYNLRTVDAYYALIDAGKQLAFMQTFDSLSAIQPSTFTVVQKSCNVYSFFVDGHSMSRCDSCVSDTSDVQTVKFHLTDSDHPWSQWKVTIGEARYLLKIDGLYGYLTYRFTPSGQRQLSLATAKTEAADFVFEKVN